MTCAECQGSGYVTSSHGARYAHPCPSCFETSKGIALLSPRRRQVVELLNLGHGATEIGRRMGLSRTTVNALAYQARKQIASGVPSRRAGRPRNAPTTRDKIRADIAAGKHCGKCWLLTPCDHTP